MCPQYKFGSLEKVALSKLRTDNDIKVIVQGADSATGIGKTTLAIKLCRTIDEDWSAEEKAFIDIRQYINAHLNKEKGSALLLDEIEKGADSRRFMTQENVDLSQAWATMRARNIATVCTLPTISMLDKRMLELADYWVLVKRRGIAQAFKVSVNDFTGKISRKPFPGDEHMWFGDLPEDDPDKEYLDNLKDDMLLSEESGYISKEEHNKELEKKLQESKMEWRDGIVKEMYEKTSATQNEISDLSFVDVRQNRVSQIVNSD